MTDSMMNLRTLVEKTPTPIFCARRLALLPNG